MTATSIYNGELRTTCVHLKSNQQIITDAPIDNNGKGEAFSPTDLVATALASCMLTIMGIKANSLSIDISGTKITLTKTMSSQPRRISKIDLIIDFPNNSWDKKTQTILKKAAINCPVAKSIHSDIEISTIFNF